MRVSPHAVAVRCAAVARAVAAHHVTISSSAQMKVDMTATATALAIYAGPRWLCGIFHFVRTSSFASDEDAARSLVFHNKPATLCLCLYLCLTTCTVYQVNRRIRARNVPTRGCSLTPVCGLTAADHDVQFENTGQFGANTQLAVEQSPAAHRVHTVAAHTVVLSALHHSWYVSALLRVLLTKHISYRSPELTWVHCKLYGSFTL